MGYEIGLSPSKIGDSKNCSRCFFDAINHKIPAPRGIFPSLPNGVDRVMKDMMDSNRKGWPTPLVEEMKGRSLWGSVEQVKKIRHWKSGLSCEVTVTIQLNGKERTVRVGLIGALDDLVIEETGLFSPYDTKTKGDEPKDAGLEYYQHQLDCYALMLQENKMPPSGKGYLNYWYPVTITGTVMEWKHKLYEVTADPTRGLQWVADTVTVLLGTRPAANPKCEQCKWFEARFKLELTIMQAKNAQAQKEVANV